jgi:hypothetical protein
VLITAANKRDLQKTFGRVLNGILSGTITSAPEGNGLDDITNNALNELSANRHAPAQYTLAAYDAFAGQLSGAHADAEQAEVLNLLNNPGVSR